MQQTKYPFAVRLIGFPEHETSAIDGFLAAAGADGRGRSYFRLEEDNLQDPDLFLTNADEPRAMIALNYLGPSDLRPALLIGSAEPEPSLRSYLFLPKPVRPKQLIAALDQLVERRADALSRLEASDVVTVPERRRRDRTALDSGSAADFAHMRRPAADGGVVVVDKDATLADYVSGLLQRRQLAVHWVKDEIEAVALCRRQKISLVVINTSTPGVDSYRLCESIKSGVAERLTVIFLIGSSHVYDQTRARNSGCDGFLNKPLTTSHVISVLKKFLPALSR